MAEYIPLPQVFDDLGAGEFKPRVNKQKKRGSSKGTEYYAVVKFEGMDKIKKCIHAYPVWIILCGEWNMTKKEWVTVPRKHRRAFGIDNKAVHIGLRGLEKFGMVELRKKERCYTEVRKL